MRRILSWLKARIGPFALLPYYVKAIAKQWTNILFGETIVGAAFLIYWALVNPSNRVLIAFFTVAALVAGYYIWYADHVRLIPKLTVGPLQLTYSSPKGPNAPEKGRFVQVIVNCATECPLENCRGKLLSISKRNDGKWEPTRIDEPIDLWWSFVDGPTVLLEDGAPGRLTVVYVENTSRNLVTATQIPVRLAYSPSDILKFNVRVAAKDCPAEYIYFKVTFGDQWCDLYSEIIRNEV